MQLDLSFELPLNDDEERQLAGILRTTPDQMAQALTPVALAATQEYVRMFLGQKVFTRGSDILEYRLFLLVKEVFNNKVPDEQRISDLFQVTANGSRSLTRSVLSKYQYELHDAVHRSLNDTVDAAVPGENGDYEVAVYNEGITESLNRMLGSEDSTLPPIGKKRGTVCTYVIKPSAYQCLCRVLGVEPKEQ
jgi:hypothetical protein